MKRLRRTLAFGPFLLIAALPPAHAYQKEAGPARECAECHTLSPEEAGKILGKMVDKVVGVVPGPFPGTWEVVVEKGGKTNPLYLDYSGKYLFNGQVIRTSDMENLTGLRDMDFNRRGVSTILLSRRRGGGAAK